MVGKKYYMTQQTLTDKIFELNAPYDNPYQGSFPRILFVCSAGILRSAAAATIASGRGINARAVGSSPKYALIPVSVNLIEWAHRIVFVNPENKAQVLKTFANTGYEEDIERKSVVWNIPDNYEYMHPTLMLSINAGLDDLIETLPARNSGYVGKTAWDV